jgi:hypothetical protein
VELRFAGLADSVAARAEASAEGLTLHAALPFLELGSELGVSFGDGSSERRGTIAGVEITSSQEQPTPVLCVRVSLDENAAAGQQTHADSRPNEDASARRAAWFALAITLLAFGLAAAGPVSWLKAERAARGAARGAPASQARASVAAVAPPASTAAATIAPQLPALPPPVLVPQLSVTAPITTVEGATTHLFIPMDGDESGMRTYELSSPGLVVNLPHARARIPLDDYAIGEGLVRRAWLRPLDDGVQLRVVWRTSSVGYHVLFGKAGLTLVAALRARR